MIRFFAAVKRPKFDTIGKTAFTTPTFFLFKIRIPLEAMCCKLLEDFTERNSRKSQIKPYKP